jgi:hypothetical protein
VAIKKRAGKGELERNPSEDTKKRRSAIKRIAAALAGAVGAGVLAKPTKSWGRYISIEGSYVDTVYVSGYRSYSSYTSYYNSYRSHYSSVPPPYSSSRR